MRSIAFYGKGGIGKTSVASCMSILFASAGRRVLHIGCDPKHDSCYKLVPDQPMRTVMGTLMQLGSDEHLPIKDLIMVGFKGVHCIEAGGPEPGVGCAGRGITKTMEMLSLYGLPGKAYDVVVCDVLGDVVCGGFAAPMRIGFAKEIYIVVSGEVMAMYAANNICRAVVSNRRNGIALGGLVANLRNLPHEIEILERFASTLGTRLLHPIPMDESVQIAERSSLTVLTFAPLSDAARHYEALFDEIERTTPEDCVIPTPLEYDVFRKFIAEESFR